MCWHDEEIEELTDAKIEEQLKKALEREPMLRDMVAHDPAVAAKLAPYIAA